jgi:DHA1 family bicyclomycin/chloramphenicol resistance-like MFS transporter
VIGIAPIISPSVGGWLFQFGGWGSIFWALACFGCMCGVAVAIDLPETHPMERRSRDSITTVFRHYAALLVDFRYMGYAVPVSLALGLIFAYVASSPSVFMQYYKCSPTSFSLIFASNAVGLIGAAQVNRWLTRHHDTHAILRSASVVNALAAISLPVLAYTGIGGFPAIFANLFVCLATVGLILPNATAAVMAPYPHQAGVASALLGMLQFSIGAATGAIVGLFHDGTARPMAVTMAGCAVISLAITMASERTKRFRTMSVTRP